MFTPATSSRPKLNPSLLLEYPVRNATRRVLRRDMTPSRAPVLRALLATTALLVSVCSAQNAPTPAASTPTASIPRDPDRESLLALSWKEFDQTQNSGWRIYVNPTRKDYAPAIKLIEDYLVRHDELLPRQRAICHYHGAHHYIYRAVRAGQGDPRDAIPHLDQAIVPQDTTPPSADWNDLVLATKAFLLGDRATLLAVKARVAALPLGTVKYLQSPSSPDDLLTHLGQPYGDWFPKPAPKP